MNCPGCKQPLEALNLPAVEVDQCRRCRGVWFDHGEVDDLFSLPKVPERFLSIELHHTPPAMVPEGERVCPRCAERLKTIEVEGITLDACSACKGFFADPGEVKGLLVASERSCRPTRESE